MKLSLLSLLAFLPLVAASPPISVPVSVTTRGLPSMSSLAVNGSLPSGPLVGCPQLDFSIPVQIGGQTFELLLDSGSSTLAIASTLCTGCADAGVSPLADFSRTAQYPGGSRVSGGYGDGSGWSGKAYKVNLVVGNAPATDVIVASIDRETGNFFASEGCSPSGPGNTNQGIIGLMWPFQAIAPTSSWFFDLVKQHSEISPAFAIELCGTNGELWIGGSDPAAFAPGKSLQYTSIPRNANYFDVVMNDFKVNGVSLGITGPSKWGETIVDSGTTQLLIIDSAYRALMKALSKNKTFAAAFGDAMTFFEGGNCFAPRNRMTPEQLNAALPRLQLVLGDLANGESPLTLDIGAVSSYLLQQGVGSSSVYCPMVGNGGAGGFGSVNILGWAVMNQFIVEFQADKSGTQRNGRIGFVPVDANRCGEATHLGPKKHNKVKRAHKPRSN